MDISLIKIGADVPIVRRQVKPVFSHLAAYMAAPRVVYTLLLLPMVESYLELFPMAGYFLQFQPIHVRSWLVLPKNQASAYCFPVLAMGVWIHVVLPTLVTFLQHFLLHPLL